MAEEPTFEELFRQAERSAVHLEMRDGYMKSDPRYVAWARDPESVTVERDPGSRPWLALMEEITGRGVEVRRARIFSEPMSDYLRFEHHLTPSNVAVGEQVRWLPRRRASDLALPGTTSGCSTTASSSSCTSPGRVNSPPRATKSARRHRPWYACAPPPSRRSGNAPSCTRSTGRSDQRGALRPGVTLRRRGRSGRSAGRGSVHGGRGRVRWWRRVRLRGRARRGGR